MKIIKNVPIEKGGTLYLYGYDKEGELVFRSSFNMQRLQNEPVLIHEGVCYVGLYKFPVKYLDNLPEEPIENQQNKK